MPMDIEVARAVFQARQIERALNDPGPWTVGYGSHVAPAVRWVTDREIIFAAHFPDACWMDDDGFLTLRCRDEVVGTRTIDTPEDGEWKAEWTFSLTSPAMV